MLVSDTAAWTPIARCCTQLQQTADQPRRRRQLRVVSARSKPQTQFIDGTDSRKAVDQAVRLADRQKARPVNPDEAAKGKLDIVKVRDWGSGEPAELDQLQVESCAGDYVTDDEKQFYVTLARQLELLEAKGALSAAQPQDSKPLPPFERWSMTGPRYVQFLTDLWHVHLALEKAVPAATSEAFSKGYDQQESCSQAMQALQCFSAATGLHRSNQMRADLAALRAAPAMPDAAAVTPSGHALAFAQVIDSTRNQCMRGDARSWAKGAIRLIANAYCIQVTNLSMGMRIGSAAAEKLNLFQLQAVHTWRAFPEQVGRNPVVTFTEYVNRAGTLLSTQQRQAVMDELAPCMIRASMLLLTLAHEN